MFAPIQTRKCKRMRINANIARIYSSHICISFFKQYLCVPCILKEPINLRRLYVRVESSIFSQTNQVILSFEVEKSFAVHSRCVRTSQILCPSASGKCGFLACLAQKNRMSPRNPCHSLNNDGCLVDIS